MSLEHNDAPTSYRSRIDTAGRLVIPAGLRQRNGLRLGDEVVLVPHAHSVEIKTYEQIVREAQDLFCNAAPANRMVSEELIEDRRRDAALDD